MEFDNSLEVPLPPAEAWNVLLDIERVAACIPGAKLTEVVDERTFKGQVAVRIGPVALSLVGQARLEDIDAAGRRVSVKAQGADPKGRGSTEAMIRFHLEPVETGTRVNIHSDVKLAGAIAQYGRGAGMIQSVASQLIGQFGDNLKARIAGGGAGEPGAAKPISGLTVLGKAVWDQVGQAAKKPKA
jgi:carbon monoxide dehydrogenase subunit G